MINLEPRSVSKSQLSSDCLLVPLRFFKAPVTDSGAAHRSRARRVHRAPHPRASTASLNPAERSAAEIRRESHRPRAARRVFARDPWIRHPAEWGAPPSPGKAGPPKRAGVTSRSRTRAASACFLSRDTADTRLTDERLLDRRCARADDSGVLRAAPASRRVHPILLEAC